MYSNREKRYTEINVTVVKDLEECWISEDTVKRLELKRQGNETGLPEWGTLGYQSVEFHGTTTLQWLCNSHSRPTQCRIVTSSLFEIYLPSSLLPSASPFSTAVTAPTPISTSLAFDANVGPAPSSSRIDLPVDYTGQFDGEGGDEHEEVSASSKEY